jgi:hypothetical protein
MADEKLDRLEDSFHSSLGLMQRRKAELEAELPMIDLAISVLAEKLADIRQQRREQNQ